MIQEDLAFIKLLKRSNRFWPVAGHIQSSGWRELAVIKAHGTALLEKLMGL